MQTGIQLTAPEINQPKFENVEVKLEHVFLMVTPLDASQTWCLLLISE